MVTPEQITKIRAEAGLPPLPVKTPTSQSNDEIIRRRKEELGIVDTPVTEPVKVSGPMTAVADEVKGATTAAKDFVSNTGATYKNAPSEFINEAGRNDESTNKNAIVRTGENALAATASGVNTVFAPVTSAVKAYTDAAANQPSLQAIASHPAVSKILDLFGGAGDQIHKWADQHPEAARNLGNLITVGGAAIGSEAEPTVNSAIKTGTQAVKSAATDVVAPAIKSTVVNAAEGAKAIPGEIKTAVTDLKNTRATEKAYQAITPDVKNLPPNEYQKLLEQRRVTPAGINQPPRYVLSDAEKFTAEKYKDVLQGKNAVKNSMNLMAEIAKKDGEVGTFLKKNNSIFNTGELKNYISEKMSGLTDVMVPEERVTKLTNQLIENFTNELPKNDMESLWQHRKSFDQKIDNAFKGSPTLQKEAKLQLRNAVQDYISEKTPDTTYADYMKDMRQLYKLNDNIFMNAKTTRGFSELKKWVKENPVKAAAIGIGLTYFIAPKALNAAGAAINK